MNNQLEYMNKMIFIIITFKVEFLWLHSCNTEHNHLNYLLSHNLAHISKNVTCFFDLSITMQLNLGTMHLELCCTFYYRKGRWSTELFTLDALLLLHENILYSYCDFTCCKISLLSINLSQIAWYMELKAVPYTFIVAFSFSFRGSIRDFPAQFRVKRHLWLYCYNWDWSGYYSGTL